MKPTVLLVDDEPNILEGLKRNLRKEPYRILIALSAKEALKILENNPIDVVVSDHDMPGMNGTELLAEVHKRYPDTLRFILTGKATLQMAIDAINKGAVHRFFTKPCHHFDLGMTICEALRQRELLAGTRRLLTTLRHQNNIIETLERNHPGIAAVARDETGAIHLGDVPNEFGALIHEIHEQVARAEGKPLSEELASDPDWDGDL